MFLKNNQSVTVFLQITLIFSNFYVKTSQPLLESKSITLSKQYIGSNGGLYQLKKTKQNKLLLELR